MVNVQYSPLFPFMIVCAYLVSTLRPQICQELETIWQLSKISTKRNDRKKTWSGLFCGFGALDFDDSLVLYRMRMVGSNLRMVWYIKQCKKSSRKDVPKHSMAQKQYLSSVVFSSAEIAYRLQLL